MIWNSCLLPDPAEEVATCMCVNPATDDGWEPLIVGRFLAPQHGVQTTGLMWVNNSPLDSLFTKASPSLNHATSPICFRRRSFDTQTQREGFGYDGRPTGREPKHKAPAAKAFAVTY